MSFSDRQGGLVLGTLMGRTATFVMDGREANIRFAQALMKSVAEADMSSIVLDFDAFYSSNADIIFTGLPKNPVDCFIRVPAPGADAEAEFSALFEAEQQVIIIDSLNSLYHLISEGNGSARGRKMTFALASLSQLARVNHRPVILSMYRREGFARSGKGRPISSLSDITASVAVREGRVEIRAERGPASPRVFPSRIP
jgi:hypothetical protein